MKKIIRRCREHVHVLRDNETCSFAEHSKHNKIEEMTEQEAEVLEWVEINTTVEQWEKTDAGQKELCFWPKNHYKTQKFYYKVVVFNPQTQNLEEVIGDNFREISQLIVEDINGNVQKENNWVFKKVVYQFCPDAICGQNPCVCKPWKLKNHV